MRQTGFTIVEIIVVVSVLGILVGIGALSLSGIQQKSTDSQARSIAAAIRSASERYYARNNEYPSAQSLHGSSPTNCSTPSSYQTASDIIDVPTGTMKQSRASLSMWPAAGTCSPVDTTKIYYVTKNAGDASSRARSISGCTYTFSSSETGPTAYFIAYYSIQGTKWYVTKSSKGIVEDTSSCGFTAL